jgi:hypothetical protein
VLGLEGSPLQVHDHITSELQVVEEQVQVEVLVRHLHVDLPADERETSSEFQQEFGNVPDQTLLQVPLQSRLTLGKKIEDVGILQCLLGKVRLRMRKAFRKVGSFLGQDLAFMKTALDLEGKRVTPPPMLQRFFDVPCSLARVLGFVQENAKVSPRQLCSRLLHNWRPREIRSEFPHILEVTWGEPLHVGEGISQIEAETVDDLATPALGGLTVENLLPDLPVH